MSNNIKMTTSHIALGSSLCLIFTLLISACQPAPAPTEPPAPPTPPPAATTTTKPEPQSTAEPVVASAPEVDLSAQLVGPLWLLLGYGDAGNPTVIEPGTTVTAQFAEDGSLNGSAGCNNFFGSYEMNGEQIKIGPLGSTMMACEQGMNQEAILLAALQSAYKIAFTPQAASRSSTTPARYMKKSWCIRPARNRWWTHCGCWNHSANPTIHRLRRRAH